ncbi:exodeoxyribonuclease VII small subunit [Knoellia sp. Soil729]|uniref:exodeoxyribonuclease VII small subunit n=1 Tax=Knoellia sp. Soil729 TaxID=1736394 RepID=UPI0006FEEC17|nr:exodeoxyribonuclease VII small subunit [Knoellia sp. Soil729]KRE43043.1 hypothetical protein ASG74_06845 [Knoellia sp. Soil729]
MAKETPQPEPAQDRTSGAEVPSTDGTNADVADLSYEAARDELVDIVARLENGQVGLEDSMGLWQRGEALAAHCAQWLDEAEARLSE